MLYYNYSKGKEIRKMTKFWMLNIIHFHSGIEDVIFAGCFSSFEQAVNKAEAFMDTRDNIDDWDYIIDNVELNKDYLDI